MSDKKLTLFYVLDILKEHTDKNHLLTQAEINKKLNILHEIELDRKTISSHIQLLIDYGYDIVQVPKKGYYLDKRDLDENQIKFLIDAVYSSKMLTGDAAKEISKKLYSNLSIHEQKDFTYIHKSTDINRSSVDIFENIEIITKAIQEQKKICFKYLKFDKKGNLVEKKVDQKYYVSPYYLVNNFSKYYLICSYSKSDRHINYRVDFMKDIEILDKEIRPYSDVPSLGAGFNISKHLNDHIYMFAGDVIHARVELDEKGVTYVKDWFGSNATIMEIDDKIYASIKSNEEAFFYWVLQYVKHVKVIEPKSMVDRIVETLEESLGKYKQ